nr:uncharacterized protein LOC109414733 [Aedes albopictus]
MVQAYEDEEKISAAAANSMPKPSGSGMATSVSFPPTIVLQQTALPTFDGRYENWFKFQQMFRDVADKCTADSAATKLHYLDKALVGKAQGATDQQIIRDNDYEGAWQSLKDQFENLPALIADTTTRLLNLKALNHESFSSLKCLIDDVEKCVSSLEYHGLQMDKMSEAIVISLTASKLDPSTRKAWESSVERGKLPVYKEMIAILKNQLAILERCERAKPQTKPKGSNSTTKYSSMSGVSKSHTAIVNKSEEGCALCHADHSVEHCDAFKKLNANARYGKARQFGLCFLCLNRGHRTNDCKTVRKCTACSRNHHSLLHPEEHKESQTPKGVVETTPDVKTIDKPAAKDVSPSTNCQVSCNNNEVQQQVLLATAVVYVIDASGQRHVCRALLDSGAMASFMSQHLADLLDLRKETADVPVVGVTGMRTTVKFKVRARVESCSSNYAFYQDYLIVPRVTGALPTNPVEADRWPIPQDLYLADSRFYEPNRVDLLIGAEIFFELLLQGKIKMADELPVLQESVFGWLVSGRVIESTASNVQVYHVAKDEPSDKELVKITDAVEVKIDRIVLWSDSKIVLRWIDYLKADAPVFVRNRITCIRQATRERNYEWKYIPSEFNPADLISRGVYPASLKAYDLWWQGPAFLQAADFEECCKCEHEPGDANNRSLNDEVVAAAIIPDNSPMAMIMKHSDFRKLQRIFGYVTRFVQHCRKAKGDRKTGGLQIGDHREAMLT